MAPERSREVAHTIADMIYEALTGKKGVFNTRIMFVHKSGHDYQLQVADVDGSRAQTILRSKEPIMSPSWSPDGHHIAYVSFESKKPVVWVQDLATGQRHAVANFKGSNSAPALEPGWQQAGSGAHHQRQLAGVSGKCRRRPGPASDL
ncbi:DPP IV N-terminal domain-containing protein [Paludibacterium denitrificans]|uniref:DPP IV N-terminal domain-containing protein n=1 Tax=Paludibacterium denitrificans TaxID=2675226 RepID=UPI001E46DCB1|nr:DPP IV N-terminal domain-containing protein [Paludibacterium denitrificans]